MQTTTDKQPTPEQFTLTVQDLRRQGYTVDISHKRRVKGERGSLVYKSEIENKDMLDPKGGATEARIVSPSGKEAFGCVNVYYKDSYHKKAGIHYAIERALENLNSQN